MCVCVCVCVCVEGGGGEERDQRASALCAWITDLIVLFCLNVTAETRFRGDVNQMHSQTPGATRTAEVIARPVMCFRVEAIYHAAWRLPGCQPNLFCQSIPHLRLLDLCLRGVSVARPPCNKTTVNARVALQSHRIAVTFSINSRRRVLD